MPTPCTESKAVDHGGFLGEVEFMVRCGVQGMVWPPVGERVHVPAMVGGPKVGTAYSVAYMKAYLERAKQEVGR